MIRGTTGLMRRLLPFWAVGAILIATAGCASDQMGDGPSVAVTPPPGERELVKSDPELKDREIVALPAKRSSAFDFSSAIAGVAETSEPVVSIRRTTNNLYDVVTVHWGTDRKLASGSPVQPVSDTAQIVTGSIGRISPPGPDRGRKLRLGRAHITIPRIVRDKGRVLRPRKITFLKYTLYAEEEDPRKHFTLGSLELMDETSFVHSVNDEASKAVRFKDQAFVFVHGFNITFENALYRTAQLAYDLDFDGAAYLYSWPSRAEKRGYLYDRDSSDRAQKYLLEFLTLVAEKTNAKRIHVIAHSLGVRPLVESLEKASAQRGHALPSKLDQIVLAAPDMDSDVFLEVAKAFNKAAKTTTLYAADNDRALQASRFLARGTPRAGEVTEKGPVIVGGIDSIDISDASTGSLLSLNHHTYAEGRDLLADIRRLMSSGVRPPHKRFARFERKSTVRGTYWKYVREAVAQN